MTLDELKRLDPNKIGSWPMLPKLGVLLLLLGAVLFAEKRNGFSQELKRMLPMIDAAVGDNDLPEVARAAHKLAGSAAIFGAAPLQASLVALERAAHAHAVTEVQRLNAEVAEATQKVLLRLAED